jgi:hypothetical protein
MISWWTGLPWKLRMGVALALLLLSTILFFAGYLWIWGWLIGVVLLMFSFPNDAEKRGYHDF